MRRISALAACLVTASLCVATNASAEAPTPVPTTPLPSNAGGDTDVLISLEPTGIDKLRAQLAQQPAAMNTGSRFTDSFEILGGAGNRRGGYYSGEDGGSLQQALKDIDARWLRNHADQSFVVDGLRVPEDGSQPVRAALATHITETTSVASSMPVAGGSNGAEVMDLPTQKDWQEAAAPSGEASKLSVGDPNPGVHWDVPDTGVLNTWIDANNYAIIYHAFDGLGNFNKSYGPWDTVNPAGGTAYEHDFKLYGGSNACDTNAWWAIQSDTTWSSTLPRPYLDTGASDPCNVEDITVGAYHAFALDSRKHYEITMGTRRGTQATSRATLVASALPIANYPDCGIPTPWCVGLTGSDQNRSYINANGFTVPGCYTWEYAEGGAPCAARPAGREDP